MDFNVTEYKKFIDMVSDSTLQLTFKKLPFVEFYCSIKEAYAQLSEKAIKILLHFQATYLCEARFSSYTSKRTYLNRLNAEADMTIQLSSIKSDIKEICKNVKHISCFVLENIIIFHKKKLLIITCYGYIIFIFK